MDKTFSFQSSRHFTFFDTVISHGQLLLRSQKNETSKKNIDIIFTGTSYVQLLYRFDGISIRLIEKKTEYGRVNKLLSYSGNHMFEITSSDEVYYIIASAVFIFENELEFHETSLGLENKGRETLIASSSHI